MWAYLTALVLLALAVAGWQLRDADLLPDVVVMSKGVRVAERLTEQGDRALAAGQVFEPLEGSALKFYEAAYAANPGDADAAHGLRITSERLAQAIEAAIEADESDRAFELTRALSLVPREIFDPTPIRSALASARGRWVEKQKHAERIDAYLAGAGQDIAEGRLVGAGTANALAKYRAIQVLEPDNAAARDGVRELGTRLARRARETFEAGDLDAAANALAQARVLNPDAPDIGQIEADIAAARSEAQALEARASEIEQLLRSARNDIGANRLSSPQGNNALERYRRVLEIDPKNPDARRGVDDIHDRYVLQATRALKDGELDKAANAIERARLARPGSPRVAAFEQELATARDRNDRAEAERLAAEAQQQIEAAARAREEAESARLGAELERRRRQEEEATRLLAEANRKAAAEAAAQKADDDALNARPRLVVDFYGFDPRFSQYYLTIERLEQMVYPLLREAGYEILKRDVYHDRGSEWSNVKLLVYKLYVNVNTATGLYSYIGSVNLFPQNAVMMELSSALKVSPIWTRGQNGLGPPTDLRLLLEYYTSMTKEFLRENRRLLQPPR